MIPGSAVGGAALGGTDGVPIGPRGGPQRRLGILPGRHGRTRIRDVPSFVTIRGGAYFFMPGMSALRHLADGAVAGPAR